MCLLRISPLDYWPDILVKTIAVLGGLAALPFGILWYLVWGLFFLSGKSRIGEIPRWLFWTNLFFIPAILFYRVAG